MAAYGVSLRRVCTWLLCCLPCFAQATLDIHFEDHSAGFWGRYVLVTAKAKRPGWVVSEFKSELKAITGIPASNATHFKAILYAPGCALQAVDMPITESRPYQYFFTCEPLADIEIEGSVAHPDVQVEEPGIKIEAKYVADWAADFFGYDDGTTTEIPLDDEASWNDRNHFRLSVPDFSKDKLAGSPDRPGEIRIWVRDQASGQIVDQLRVSPESPAEQRTRLGGIPIEALRISPVPLVFTVCAAQDTWAHDRYGFAIRNSDACELLP